MTIDGPDEPWLPGTSVPSPSPADALKPPPYKADPRDYGFPGLGATIGHSDPKRMPSRTPEQVRHADGKKHRRRRWPRFLRWLQDEEASY